MLIVCPACASEYALDPERIGPGGRRVRCAQCRESWRVAPPASETAPPSGPPASEDATRVEAAPPAVEQPAPGGASEPDASPAPASLEALAEAAPPADVSPALEAAAPVTVESRDHTVTPRKAAPPRRGRIKRPKRAAGRGAGDAPAPRPSSRRLAVAASILAVCLALAAAVAGRSAAVAAFPRAASLYAAIGLPVNLVGLSFADVSSTMTEAPGRPPTILVVEGRIENASRREVEVPPIDLAVVGEAGEVLYRWSAAPALATLQAGEGTSFRARLASPPPAGQRLRVTFRTEGSPEQVALR